MEPITRKEKYLAKISGEDVQIPEKPITREEMYLNAIAQGSSGGDGYSKDEIDQKIQEVKALIDTALEGYVKKTDYASYYNAGIVKAEMSSPNDLGIYINGNNRLQLSSPTDATVTNEQSRTQALNPSNIPLFMKNYGLNSKTHLETTYATKAELEELAKKVESITA